MSLVSFVAQASVIKWTPIDAHFGTSHTSSARVVVFSAKSWPRFLLLFGTRWLFFTDYLNVLSLCKSQLFRNRMPKETDLQNPCLTKIANCHVWNKVVVFQLWRPWFFGLSKRNFSQPFSDVKLSCIRRTSCCQNLSGHCPLRATVLLPWTEGSREASKRLGHKLWLH